MPRILSEKELQDWLDPHSDPVKLSLEIARPPEGIRLRHRPVTRDVNSPRNDFPELLTTRSETDLFGNVIDD
jgi:putative SOS response-associated peptidase YedK